MIHAAVSAAPPGAARVRSSARWPALLARGFVPAALLLSVVPLLLPRVPPLLDLPNSMSRYRIALDYASSPYFHRWFDFHWTIVGNLGVDLLVAALAPLMGLEPGVHLIVAAIPLLTVAGMALIAREAHGRVPLTAALGFACAYNYPLAFGFVNYCLTAALALLAFGGWLALGRLGHHRLRAALLAPVGIVVFVGHACGWGMLGVMIFAAAFADHCRRWRDMPRAFGLALVDSAPLLLALAPLLLWMTAGSFGHNTIFNFSLSRKFTLFVVALKNDIGWIDVGSVAVVWLPVVVAIARDDVRFDRRLTIVAAAMATVVIVVPDIVAGSSYVDLRLAPYALALWTLAIRPVGRTRFTMALCTLAVGFFGARMAYEAASFVRLDRGFTAQLEAVPHIPIGARVFGFAQVECLADWNGDRMDHVNRMAIVRRQAYTNDTWPPTTAQGLVVHPDMVAGYHDLDSQKLVPPDCPFGTGHTIGSMLAALPRDRFDYLWLIDIAPARWPQRPWLQPVWRGEKGILYRIRPAAADAPARS